MDSAIEKTKKPRPNAKLKQQRNLRGWSQEVVAERIGTDSKRVGVWECGESIPSPFYREKLCTLFNKDAEELGFIESNVQVSEANFVSSDQPPLMTNGLQEQPLVYPPDQSYSDEILDRLLKAVKRPSSIDDKVITNFEMMTKNHWQLYAGFENSIQYRQDMLYSVSGHLQSITRLINSLQPTHTQKRLYDLASETTQLIGEIFFDLKDNATAERYYNMSIELAREAQNNVLLAVTLGRKSFIPIHSNNTRKALPFLQTAYTKLTGDSTNIIRAWLLAREAEVHANINDADACLKALEKAEFYLNAAQPGEAPSYAFLEDAVDIHFTRSMLLGYKGACYIRLKKTSDAQTALKEDLAFIDPARAIHNAIVLVDLARTYIQQGEIEEAYRHANDALSMMVQLRSGRVFQRILNLRQELEPWKNTAYVQDLDEQIATLPYTS